MTGKRWGRVLWRWLTAQIAFLYPGCFALVMATGIISNGMQIEGRTIWSDVLFIAALSAYAWLLLLLVLRSLCFRSGLWADLKDPTLVFAFFTLVAGSSVLGLGLDFRSYALAAGVLWIAALAVWIGLIYFSFGLLIVLKKDSRVNVVHGSWLNAIVGTESLVLLGATVASQSGALSPTVFVLIHWLWGIGLALYGMFISLLAYRLFFSDVAPEDLSPVLWIVMGAAMISANAGSALISTESGVPFLNSMRPFIDAVTLLIWAWGTWWIPLLLLLGFWKHVVCQIPLVYTPALWSLVFPLGMHAVATWNLSLAADIF